MGKNVSTLGLILIYALNTTYILIFLMAQRLGWEGSGLEYYGDRNLCYFIKYRGGSVIKVSSLPQRKFSLLYTTAGIPAFPGKNCPKSTKRSKSVSIFKFQRNIFKTVPSALQGLRPKAVIKTLFWTRVQVRCQAYPLFWCPNSKKYSPCETH